MLYIFAILCYGCFRSCPQCRVKSAFYVPSKQWVEGQEKERLIAAFRERSRYERFCSWISLMWQ